MAAKLEEVLGCTTKLIPKGRGIFDVEVDGRLIYSKFETGTFPDQQSLIQEIQSYKEQLKHQ